MNVSENVVNKARCEYVKCILIGHGNAGKTSLGITYGTNEFPSEYVPTVFDVLQVKENIDGQSVELCMWDTGGGEDYERLRPLCYPQTNVFLVCFSLDNTREFENIQSYWFAEVRRHCPGVPMILLGMRLDLREDKVTIDKLNKKQRVPITYSQGLALASDENNKILANCDEFKAFQGKDSNEEIVAVQYMECSALTREGVEEVFEMACRVGLRHRQTKKKKKKRKCSIM